VCSFVPATGDLEPVYVQAEPLTKALGLRAEDRPVNLSVDGTDIVLVHGEYTLRLPTLAGTFSMEIQEPTTRFDSAGFQDRLAQVASAVSKEDKTGILLEWSDQRCLMAAVSKGHVAHLAHVSCPPGVAGRFCLSRSSADQLGRLGELTSWWDAGEFLYFESATAVLRVSPIRDSYPKKLELSEEYSMTCEFSVESLLAAFKAATVVLGKEDIDAEIASVGKTADGSAVFEIRGKTFRSKATAVEKVLGKTDAPVAWEGRCNVKDVVGSLGAFSSKAVSISFGKRSLVVSDGSLQAYLSLLV
jgi:hypothetical protein